MSQAVYSIEQTICDRDGLCYLVAWAYAQITVNVANVYHLRAVYVRNAWYFKLLVYFFELFFYLPQLPVFSLSSLIWLFLN